MARPRSTHLSTTHDKIARAIAAIERAGFPALVSELVQKLGLAGSSSLVPTLKIMQRNGFIAINGGGGQGRDHLVKLTPKGRYAISEGGLPVLGAIRAGPLEEAVAEHDTILEDADLLPHRPGDFLLRVRGDSMIGDGILSGDHVLLRPNVEAAQGEIAAVLTGEESGDYEATLKRVYREGAKVRLKASNPAYDDRVLPASDVKIAGVFRGLIRHAESR
jgi:repressor LexA